MGQKKSKGSAPVVQDITAPISSSEAECSDYPRSAEVGAPPTTPPPEGCFYLRVASGYSGLLPRMWGDTEAWYVAVRPEDTLAQVIEKTRAAGGYSIPSNPANWLVAPKASTRLESEHGNLPQPRLDATVADNKLSPEHVIRWWNGLSD